MITRHRIVPAAVSVALSAALALMLSSGVAGAAPVRLSPTVGTAAPLADSPIDPPYFQLINHNSGKCVSVPNSSTRSGERLHQFTCLNLKNFGWLPVLIPTAQGDYFFRNENQLRPNEKCMAVKNGSEAPGTGIVQEPCNYAHPPASEQFAPIEVAYHWAIFQNPHSLLCVKISGSSTSNNAGLIQEPCRDPNSTSEWFQFRTPPASGSAARR